MLTIYDIRAHVAKSNANVVPNTFSGHMGNSLRSEHGTLKKNDTARLVITARVKGTGKKMKSLIFKGRARGSSQTAASLERNAHEGRLINLWLDV